jgi:hypothetical protein
VPVEKIFQRPVADALTHLSKSRSFAVSRDAPSEARIICARIWWPEGSARSKPLITAQNEQKLLKVAEKYQVKGPSVKWIKFEVME